MFLGVTIPDRDKLAPVFREKLFGAIFIRPNDATAFFKIGVIYHS